MSAEDVEKTVKGWFRWMERLPAEIVRMNEEIARLNDCIDRQSRETREAREEIQRLRDEVLRLGGGEDQRLGQRRDNVSIVLDPLSRWSTENILPGLTSYPTTRSVRSEEALWPRRYPCHARQESTNGTVSKFMR